MKYRDGEGPRVTREPGLLDQNQQDYSTLVNRALQLQRNPPGRLDPTVQLGLTLDDLNEEEFAYLRRKYLFEASGQRALTAGQRAYIQLEPGRGTLTVVTSMQIFNNNAAVQALQVGMAIANGALTAVPTSIRDDRISTFTSQAAVSTGSNAAPIAPTGMTVTLLQNTGIIIPCCYVFTGGKGPAAAPFRCLSIVDTANANGITAAFTWTERTLLQTENT
jgi:hypothetical protein